MVLIWIGIFVLLIIFLFYLFIPKHKPGHCHDCNSAPGTFHDFGCDVEECPFCHKQLITCSCWFLEKGLQVPDDIYKRNKEIMKNKEAILEMVETKGRIPFGSETRFK